MCQGQYISKQIPFMKTFIKYKMNLSTIIFQFSPNAIKFYLEKYYVGTKSIKLGSQSRVFVIYYKYRTSSIEHIKFYSKKSKS